MHHFPLHFTDVVKNGVLWEFVKFAISFCYAKLYFLKHTVHMCWQITGIFGKTDILKIG